MKFVELTHVGVSDTPIYINPDHVVGIRKIGDKQTYLLIAAASHDGKITHIAVREEPADVVAKLCG